MKNWILRWLGLGPKQPSTGLGAPSSPRGRFLIEEQRNRNFFEVVPAVNGKIVVYTRHSFNSNGPAVNGKIVVYTRHSFNSNGPDKNDMEIYLVHDGDNLMDTITTAIVSAGLK